MTPDIQNTITEHVKATPQQLLTPITDGTVRDAVDALALIYKLVEQQKTVLENEIVFTFLGLELMSTFEARIRDNAVIEQNAIDDILEDLTITVFTDEVRKLLAGVEQHYAGLGQNTPEPQPSPVSPAFVYGKTEPVAEQTESASPTVQPIHTMEQDMDKIHGYGSYRKMYPDENTAETENAPVPATPHEQPVVQSTSQEDMLRDRLAGTPSYTEKPKE